MSKGHQSKPIICSFVQVILDYPDSSLTTSVHHSHPTGTTTCTVVIVSNDYTNPLERHILSQEGQYNSQSLKDIQVKMVNMY
jgi:hypothetical protein